MTRSTLAAADIGNACICLGLRKAARIVSRRYDETLRPVGITSGQFSILASLLTDRPRVLGSLAELLAMDRTTLNRNLKPLEALGFVETVKDAEDGRVRALRLTTRGRAVLDTALPLWRSAQALSTAQLGRDTWPDMLGKLRSLS